MGNKNSGFGQAKNKENINRKGRPKSRFTQVIEDLQSSGAEKVTKDEFIGFLAAVLSMTEDEQRSLGKDKSKPMWMRLLIKDINDGSIRYKILPDVYDRIYGKAKETYEFSGEVKNSIEMFREIKVVVNGEVK